MTDSDVYRREGITVFPKGSFLTGKRRENCCSTKKPQQVWDIRRWNQTVRKEIVEFNSYSMSLSVTITLFVVCMLFSKFSAVLFTALICYHNCLCLSTTFLTFFRNALASNPVLCLTRFALHCYVIISVLLCQPLFKIIFVISCFSLNHNVILHYIIYSVNLFL